MRSYVVMVDIVVGDVVGPVVVGGVDLDHLQVAGIHRLAIDPPLCFIQVNMLVSISPVKCCMDERRTDRRIKLSI